MTEDESLDRFGTTAFGLEMMTRYIDFRKDGVIEMTQWFLQIPLVYRHDVLELIQPTLAPCIRRPCTSDVVRRMLHTLHAAVIKIEPRKCL